MHRPLADLAVVMEAEDLVVSIPITQSTSRGVNQDVDLDRFLATAVDKRVFQA